MEILLKFTWRNIKENKFRTFLILLSIILSTALFFGSTSLAGTIEKTYTAMLKKYFGSAEVMIYTNKNSTSGFVSTDKLTPFLEELEYAVGTMQGRGIYKYNQDEVLSLNLYGYNLEEMQEMHQFLPAGQEDLHPFLGRKLIISKDTAKKYGLDLGKTINLEINGQTLRFKVAGIAEPVGLFQEDGRSTVAVVPREYLSTLNQMRDKSNVLYLKTKDPSRKSELIEKLALAYPRYTVEETIKDKDIKEYTDRMTQPFMMMLTTVLMISVFIIYTSFKVIALERIPIIGTFRSIGATRKTVNLVFLGESLVYGVLGGFLGCGLGIAFLHIMARLTTPNWVPGLKTQVVFTFTQLLIAFLVAVLLSLASSFLPIWKVSKIPVKDVVLNNIEQKHSNKQWKYWLGIFFLILPLAIPPFLSKTLIMPVGILLTLLSMVGIIWLIPQIIKLLIWSLDGLYLFLFGNEGILALKNLRDNKNIVNNIALLAIGISSLLVIKVVGKTVMTEVTSFFQNWNFQILAAAPSNADRSFLFSVRSVNGVKDAYGTLTSENVELAGTEQQIATLEGVNKETFAFMNLEVPGDPEKILQELDAGRNILLSGLLRDRLNVQAGDVIHLKTERGSKPYKIIGIMNTIENNGQYAVISERYLKMDMRKTTYNMLYIKTAGDVDQVQKNIAKKFNRTPFWNDTVQNIEVRNNQMNAQLFTILNAFSYLTVLIGIFGVLNNFIISFLERRRTLAVLRSVGLSKKQLQKMLFIEALSGGLIGGISGVAGGLLMASIIPYLLRSMGLKGNLLYSLPLFAIAVLAGIAISVIASLSPALRTSRMNIVASLKYE